MTPHNNLTVNQAGALGGKKRWANVKNKQQRNSIMQKIRDKKIMHSPPPPHFAPKDTLPHGQ